MQDFQGLSAADFKEKGQRPVSKVEIFIDPDWIDLCNLNWKNYLISADYSKGQKEQTYEPIAANFSAVIDNTDGLFHPQNSGSDYKDYFKVGRRIRFSTGFKSGGIDYLWQWFIGVISNLDNISGQIQVRGFDYLQYLTEVGLESPVTHWGMSVTKSTVNEQAEYSMPGDCNGAYLAYLDSAPIYSGKHWLYDRPNNNFIFLPDFIPIEIDACTGGTSAASSGNAALAFDDDPDTTWAVGTPTQWLRYQFSAAVKIHRYTILGPNHWWDAQQYGPSAWTFQGSNNGTDWTTLDTRNGISWLPNELKSFSFSNSTAYLYYRLNITATGDGDQIWLREVEMMEPLGTDNLVIYYFADQAPENVIADLLVYAGLYEDRAAALSDMDYEATDIIIKRVWFESGSKLLAAIQKICERIDYHFYFNWQGKPIFRPLPETESWENKEFFFTRNLMAEPNYFENIDEVRNYIIVEGAGYSEEDEKLKTLDGSDLLPKAINAPKIDEQAVTPTKIELEGPAIWLPPVGKACITYKVGRFMEYEQRYFEAGGGADASYYYWYKGLLRYNLWPLWGRTLSKAELRFLIASKGFAGSGANAQIALSLKAITDFGLVDKSGWDKTVRINYGNVALYYEPAGSWRQVDVKTRIEAILAGLIEDAEYSANLCIGGTPSSSSGTAQNAFDSDGIFASGETVCTMGTPSQWLRYQFALGKVIRRYTLQGPWHPSDASDYGPTTWTFRGSNNGIDWDTLDTRSGISWSGAEVKTFSFANSTAYLYYEWLFTATGPGDQIWVVDAEMMEYLGNMEQKYLALRFEGASFPADINNANNYRISEPWLYLEF